MDSLKVPTVSCIAVCSILIGGIYILSQCDPICVTDFTQCMELCIKNSDTTKPTNEQSIQEYCTEYCVRTLRKCAYE